MTIPRGISFQTLVSSGGTSVEGQWLKHLHYLLVIVYLASAADIIIQGVSYD